MAIPTIPKEMVNSFYYQDVGTGDTKTLLRWAQSYTLYHQNDGTFTGYARFSNGLPPITLRAIDTPPGAASGPDWPSVGTLYNAESTQYDQLRKALRNQGINLQYTNRIPATWVVLKEEVLPMGFRIQALVSPTYYSTYDTDPYQQVVSGQGPSGNNEEGLGIVLHGAGQEVSKAITLKKVSLDRQLEFFETIRSSAEKFLNPVISYKNTGMIAGRNPFNNEGRKWKPGDLVNVSRDSLDGGGLATAHIIRVYPTTVQVVWPNDENHSKENYPHGWHTIEQKVHLIFIKEDSAWLENYKTIPPDFSSRWGADTSWFTPSNPEPVYGGISERSLENLMQDSAPTWATGVTLPHGLKLNTNPQARNTDLFSEMDQISLYLRKQEALAQLMGSSL
jgi:hypothetical protein